MSIRPGLLLYVDCPCGEGELYPFRLEPFEDALPQLVLDKVLVDVAGDLADEGEVKGVVAEAGNEPHEGRVGVAEEPRDLAHGPARLVDEDLLHVSRVGGVADAYLHQQGHLVIRHRVVDDDALRNLVIGYYYEVVGELFYSCRPPADVGHKPLFSGANLYVIADPDRSFH